MTNVLITGISGFKAGHIAKRLLDEGYKVYGTLRVAYTTRRFTPPERVHILSADLLDSHSLRYAIQVSQPQVVIHLAAVSPVMYSWQNPQLYAETNFIGTINMIEILRHQHGLEGFIYASTAEVYGNQDLGRPYEETDPLGGLNSPYGVSKIAADDYVHSIGEAYSLPYVILRSTNIYGPRTQYRVVESIMKQIMNEATEKIKMAGQPHVARDFMYIDDAVDAYMLAVTKPEAQKEIFNVSPEENVSIKQLVDAIQNIAGTTLPVEWETGVIHPMRQYDPTRIALSAAKIKSKLGWAPKHTLKDGLRKTWEWFHSGI